MAVGMGNAYPGASGGKIMKTKLLALLFLVGSAAFAAPRVVVGVGVGVAPAYGYDAPLAARRCLCRPGARFTRLIGAPVLIMVLVGLRRGITDLVTTAVALRRIGAVSGVLRRSTAFEGILQQRPDAFARDGARIVVGILDGDVRGFIQVGWPSSRELPAMLARRAKPPDRTAPAPLTSRPARARCATSLPERPERYRRSHAAGPRCASRRAAD